MSTSKERPILFSAPMVRAIREDRKTQMRRVIKLPRERGEWEQSITGGHGVNIYELEEFFLSLNKI